MGRHGEGELGGGHPYDTVKREERGESETERSGEDRKQKKRRKPDRRSAVRGKTEGASRADLGVSFCGRLFIHISSRRGREEQHFPSPPLIHQHSHLCLERVSDRERGEVTDFIVYTEESYTDLILFLLSHTQKNTCVRVD